MDIIKLVKKSKKGNKLAFSTLIKIYEVDLYRVAIAMTKNEDDAFDCIQETILQAYINIPNLKNNEYFKTWLIKILINQCNAIIRKNKKILELKNIDIQTSYEKDDEALEVKEIVEKLEEDLKVLVILYYFQDMSIKDISDSLSIPEGTVKSRLSRARNKLKEILSMKGEL
ncbi:MAG: RNA polymerase sigma factor [Peptostreptococcaceae bacterium]